MQMYAIDCAYALWRLLQAGKINHRQTCHHFSHAMQVIHPPSGPVVHEIRFVCPLFYWSLQERCRMSSHLHKPVPCNINIILADFPHSLFYSLSLFLLSSFTLSALIPSDLQKRRIKTLWDQSWIRIRNKCMDSLHWICQVSDFQVWRC